MNNFIRLFHLIIINVGLFQQIESVFIPNNNILNTLHIPYKWQNKLPDFTGIILNEQLVQTLNSQQQLTDVQSLYNEAISKMYDQLPTQSLVEQFWKIYKKYDVQSFITMARAQLALYWRYRLDRLQDPHYVLLAAHCFYKIKNDEFFSRLNESTQHLLYASVKSMPSSLQYLFGKEEFCLHNVQQTEILYQSADHKINNETSQILSCALKTKEMALVQPIFEESEEDKLSDLNLALVSKNLHGYFHRLPEYENRIGANVTKHQLDNFLWYVELVDDNRLVFEQDEYLICRNGSDIYGFKDKTIYDKECQWIAGECNGKM